METMAKVCYSPDNFSKNNQQCKNSLPLTKILINQKIIKIFNFLYPVLFVTSALFSQLSTMGDFTANKGLSRLRERGVLGKDKGNYRRGADRQTVLGQSAFRLKKK